MPADRRFLVALLAGYGIEEGTKPCGGGEAGGKHLHSPIERLALAWRQSTDGAPGGVGGDDDERITINAPGRRGVRSGLQLCGAAQGEPRRRQARKNETRSTHGALPDKEPAMVHAGAGDGMAGCRDWWLERGHSRIGQVLGGAFPRRSSTIGRRRGERPKLPRSRRSRSALACAGECCRGGWQRPVGRTVDHANRCDATTRGCGSPERRAQTPSRSSGSRRDAI